MNASPASSVFLIQAHLDSGQHENDKEQHHSRSRSPSHRMQREALLVNIVDKCLEYISGALASACHRNGLCEDLHELDHGHDTDEERHGPELRKRDISQSLPVIDTIERG